MLKLKNNKTCYVQNNIVPHIFALISLIGIVLAYYYFAIVLSKLLHNVYELKELVVGIFFLFVMLFGPIGLFLIIADFETIILFMDNDKVWMNKQVTFKKDRIQYKTTIKFADIADMKLIVNNCDSRGRSISSIRSVSLKKYLVLMDENGKEKRFFVQWYTNKYLFKIMTEIVARIEAVGKVYSGASPQEVIDNYKQTERKKLL